MNLRRLFNSKQKPPAVPNNGCVPPSEEAVRRRLIILWCNCGRSYFESEHSEGAEIDEPTLSKLRNWVCGPLRSSATQGEIARHQAELGTYTSQQVVNDWWDLEAATVLQWALGLADTLPSWDSYGDWEEATHELFELEDPFKWRPNLKLRPLDQIEQQAQSYEAKYWRIRHLDRPEHEAYAKKLMGRAHALGQVNLTKDGELALSDGSPITEATEDQLSSTTSILMERLQALNWLCGHDPDWDQITCDTIVLWLWDENWV